MCNIIQLDIVNNKALCLDPFFSDQIYSITFENLINGYLGIRLVNKVMDNPNTDYINLYSLMVENFINRINCIIFEYRKFADDIWSIKYFNELFDCEDAELNLFIQAIKHIAINRHGLSDLLSTLYDNGIYKADAKDIHLLYCEISKDWEYIQLSFLKMIIIKMIH